MLNILKYFHFQLKFHTVQVCLTTNGHTRSLNILQIIIKLKKYFESEPQL